MVLSNDNARCMGHLLRLEPTNNDSFAYLANNYSTEITRDIHLD